MSNTFEPLCNYSTNDADEPLCNNCGKPFKEHTSIKEARKNFEEFKERFTPCLKQNTPSDFLHAAYIGGNYICSPGGYIFHDDEEWKVIHKIFLEQKERFGFNFKKQELRILLEKENNHES